MAADSARRRARGRSLQAAVIASGLLLLGVPSPAAAEDAPFPVELLTTPPGFTIEVHARVPGARSLAVAEGGARLVVGSRGSTVHEVLDPAPGGGADQVIDLVDGLEVPNGIAFDGDGGVLVVEQHRITRIDPAGEAAVIVPPGVLPDRRFHGWRYARFGPDGGLYVSVGAPCNVCELRGFEGTIVRLRPDGHRMEVYAEGVRNSVGFDWHPATGEMFFTDNGADFLGDRIPPDELNHAPEADRHFGFPYVYGAGTPYPGFAGRAAPGEFTPPALTFEAHAAALGIEFYDGTMFPPGYRHDAFVAQHGSWNRTDPVGYRIMRVRFDARGRPTGKEVFVDGWLRPDGEVLGRPVDLAELPDGSLLVSDDHAGLIYRITYQD